MARKKKKHRPRPPRMPEPPPRFALGAAVRIKAGTLCPDMEDIPLGGWAGVVTDIDTDERPSLYEVTWTRETLAGAHEVYHRRCQLDGLDPESCWLSEPELEPDLGTPLAMEQPTKLVPRPLDLNDPEERALSIFGLTSDDDLPPLTRDNMRRFHEYMSRKLRFPFAAVIVEPGETRIDVTQATALRLMPAEDATPDDGLFVEVRVGAETSVVPLVTLTVNPAGMLADDMAAYRLWFTESADGGQPESNPEAILMRVFGLLVLSGAVIGSVLAAFPEAGQSMIVGAAILGGIGTFALGAIEGAYRRWNHRPPGFLGGAAVGLGLGGAFGAALGGLVGVYQGTMWGAGIALAVALILRGAGVPGPRPAYSLLAGGLLGAIVQSFLQRFWLTLVGLVGGGLLGGVVAFLGIYLFSRYLAILDPLDDDKT